MSVLKSSNDHLTLNADGTSKDIKFQADGVEKASISSAGLFTSTTIDATKLTGTIPNFTSTGIDDNATSTAITIDTSGNMGLGVTPSSEWGSGYKALQVGGCGAVWSESPQSASGALRMSNNVQGTWKYIVTDQASEYDQVDGMHVFKVAASGSADAAISFTTALTIQNDGQSSFKGIALEETSQTLSNGSQITHNGTSILALNAASSFSLASDSIQDPSRAGHMLVLRYTENTSTFTLSSSSTAKITLSGNWSPDWGDTLTLIGSGVWWYEMSRSSNANY